MKVMPQDERIRAANHSCGFECLSDMARRVSGVQQHELLAFRSEWDPQCPCQPSGNRENKNQEECEDRSQVNILTDDFCHGLPIVCYQGGSLADYGNQFSVPIRQLACPSNSEELAPPPAGPLLPRVF